MINPELPMYDSDGREWVALRMPDGSVFKTESGYAMVAHGNVWDWDRCVKGLSNTKPQKDCVRDVHVYVSTEDARPVVVRMQRHNGVITAEVVDESLPT